jgi:filamentous hemagglutinin family protein
VVYGDVTISTTGRQMTVNQSGSHGIVNWNSFSVGTGNSVHFNNGSGATLNRVTGITPSRIDGTLSATGSLYLLNRNGVIIGTDGRVLTGGSFIASTRDMSDADFLDGGNFALFGDGTAGVTNLGKISSTGGNVLLAGYTVKNSGELSAANGRVGLAAGSRIDVLTDVSWLGGAYAVSLGERGNNITNEGRILAAVAELRAHNGNIYALAGNNTGLIQATGVRTEGGRVILTATGGTVQSTGAITATRAGASGVVNGGDIEIAAVSIENYGGTQNVSGATGGTISLSAESVTTDTEMLARGSSATGGSITIAATRDILFTSAGRIDASGRTSGGSVTLAAGPGANLLSGQIAATASFGLGGTVSLLGDRVSLLGAIIDASGATGGGTIHVGGGYQGASVLSSANASRTYISDKSVLRADATGAHGDGGTVVAWADGTTQFAGKITARSGTASGDGGLVETSGLEALGVSGTVDASARNTSGANGRWLLDPKNITIGTVTDSINEFQSLIQGFGGSQSDLTANTRFGGSLDLSGDTLIVGGGSINFSGSSAKTAYIFESGRISARLTNPGSSDFFSSFGEIVRIDGDIAAVADSRNQSSVNQLTNGDGTVYVYAKGAGWRNGTANLTSTIHNPFNVFRPSGNVNTAFASSMELTRSAGGQLYLAVSDTEYHADGLEDAGVLWSAPISSTGVASPLTANLAVTPYAFNNFGTVAVSNGFAYIRESDPTAITVLNLASGAKQRHQNAYTGGPIIVADGLLFSLNGSSVSVGQVFGGTSGFGSSRAIDFNANGFANSIAVSGDTMVIGTGANGFDGSVSIFQAPTGGWLASTGTNQAIRVFHQVGAASTPSGNEIRTALGAAVAIDGNTIAVGMPGLDVTTTSHGVLKDRGGVMTLRRTNGTWTADTDLLAPSMAAESTTFGQELAADGNTFIVSDDRFGDPSVPNETKRGRVYVYENGQFAASLSGIAGAAGVFDGFGDLIDISGDRIVSTSVFSFDGNTPGILGRVELFAKGSAWRNGTANRVEHYDFFGEIGGVALDGTTLAIGTPAPSSTDRGVVYVFSNIGSGLANPSLIYNPFASPGTADFFGNTLALSGNTLAVGQPRSPSAGQFGVNRGSVNETYSSTGLTDYNVILFENLANNWSGATATRLAGASILDPLQDSVGWGYSLALDGDTLVTGYRRDAQLGSTRGVYVFQRNGTWANSTTPVARLTGSARNFGFDVDINGDTIAVSSPNVLENYVYGSPTGNDSPVFVFQRQSGWNSGTTNLVSTLLPAANVINRSFGNNIALNDQSLFASTLATRVGASTAILPVFQFNGPFTLDSRATFATGPGGNLAISAAALSNSLSLGTNITLQANNDITVSQAITVNNPNGDGGDLRLEAGRRILVNASITTDNGDLTFIANTPGANASFRDEGERVIVLGRDANNASVTLSLGTGNLVIAAADRFENRTGATNPFRFATTNPGRWLVYSTTPDQTGAPDASNLQADLATAGRDWVHYNRAFSFADLAPASLPAGDGFIYTVQPTVGVTVGNASLTYGQAFTSATLSLGTVTVGGDAVSNSVFGLGLDSAALANLVNVGLAGSVSINSANGFANAGTYTGGITASAKSTVTSGAVYGVAVSTSGAGTLTVAKKTLDVRPADTTRVYRDANPAFTANYTGFVTGDGIDSLDTAVTLSTLAIQTSDVGGYAITASGGLDNNYLFNVTGAGLLTITPRSLQITGLSGVDRVYTATTAAAFTGTATIAPLGGDAVTLTGALTATASFANPDAGLDKPLTFSGYGLSGAKAANYTLVFPTGVTADITPLTLTLAGLTAQNRVYDRTTAATLSGTASITPLGSDSVSLTGTPVGAFATKTVGTAKPVTVTGLSLTGPAAANYVLSTVGPVADITPRGLNITGLAANSRVYDTTETATLSGAPAISPISGDSVTVAGTPVASFLDKHVGTAKPVSVTGYTLAGNDALNYFLNAVTGLTADITRADLTISGLVANSRIYDATRVATLSGTATVAPLGTDQLVLGGVPVATFADKHVGVAKPVSVSGYTLSGDDAGNYTLIQPAGLSATVTARPVTVAGLTAAAKVYDATDAATVTGTAAFAGILPDDDATLDGSAVTYAFADKNVGTAKPIAITGLSILGADATNYDATRAFGLTADITPATLTVTGVTAASRIYDATFTTTLSGATLSGVLLSDDVAFVPASITTGTFADKHVGTAKAVTTAFAVTGDAAANYTLVQPVGLSADITAFTLNLVGLSADKTYDGTDTAPLTFTGLDAVFAGDFVFADASAVSATYADKHAGVSRPVSINGLFGLTGDDARNYLLAQPVSLTGTIARRGITVSGLTIADKTYDGTDAATISGTGTFGGTIFGDDLAIDVGAITVSFANPNAGANKAVTLSGLTLSGDDADNYDAATPTGLTATIFTRGLALTGLAAADKTYDRTDTATITGTGSIDGVLSGETVTLDETSRGGRFADKNAGTAKAVTVTGLALTGTTAANYHLIDPGLTADISRATATVTGLTAVGRTYNRLDSIALSGAATLDFGSLNNVFANLEDIALTGTATGSVANKNVGVAKPVTIAGLSLAGLDANNYNLLLPTGLTATITAADLQITGAAVSNKTYDATRAATITSAGTVTALGTDDVTLVTSAATAEFINKTASASPKAVSITGYTLTGDDAANYALLDPVGVTASIAKADLVLSGLTADDKTYDGTRAAPLGGTLAITPLGSDDLAVTGAPVATFADANAGTAKPVTVTGLGLAGTDAANYNFIIPALTADITRRRTTVGGLTAQDRIYDGTRIAVLTGTGSLSNLISGDDIVFNLAGLSASFADKRVGTDKLVTLTGDALAGTAAANYEQLLPFDLVADILAKELSVIGADAIDRDYDRTANVALTGGALSGAITADAVSLVASAASGTVATVNVGENKPVTVTGYALTGDDAANYTLVQPTDLDVTIAPRTLTITGIQVPDRFFNGTTNATLSGGTLNGIISGDAVSLVTGTGAFADPEVGLAKPVTLSGFALAGDDAANYRLPDSITLTGNILTPLRIITDVVPAEVLRASAATALNQQRAALDALNASRPDTIVLKDYQALVASVAAGIPSVPEVPPGLRINYGPEAAGITAYIKAADAARAAADRATAAAASYRATSAAFKELGQQANTLSRALQTETALRATHLEQITAAEAELAKTEANLATIAEAKRRIATLTQQAAEADRLGRGSESAAFAAAIAEARALVATEAGLLAQRAAAAGQVARARADLAASEAKVAELTVEQTRLADELTKSESELTRLQTAAATAKTETADALAQLETARTDGIRSARNTVSVEEQRIANMESQGTPRPVPEQVERVLKSGSTFLEKNYPLSPERAAVMKSFEDRLEAARAVEVDLKARIAADEAAVKSTPEPIANLGYSIRSDKLRDLTSEQIAATDFRKLGLSDAQILPAYHSAEIHGLNTTAKTLEKQFAAFNQTDGNNLAGNFSTADQRGLASLDKPVTLPPDTEIKLGMELRQFGLLPTYEGPIARLPVATQLRLTRAMMDTKARTAELVAQGFDPNLAAQEAFNEKSAELVTMVLFEAFDTYGIGDIPGVQEFVSGSLGELGAQFGINPSNMVQSLISGDLGGVVGSPEQALNAIGKQAEKVFTRPDRAIVDFGTGAYEVLKAGGEAAATAIIGTDTEKQEKDAAIRAGIQKRQEQLTDISRSLLHLEDQRHDALAARERNLEQAKQFIIASRRPDELQREIWKNEEAIAVARSDVIIMKATTLREQVTEQVTADTAKAQRDLAIELAPYKGRLETAKSEIVILSSLAPKPSVAAR